MSPIFALKGLETPTLLEFGQRSLAALGLETGPAAARREGVPHEMVVYPKEGHNLASPVVQLESMHRNLDWFDYWMLGKKTDPKKKDQYARWEAMAREMKAMREEQRSPCCQSGALPGPLTGEILRMPRSGRRPCTLPWINSYTSFTAAVVRQGAASQRKRFAPGAAIIYLDIREVVMTERHPVTVAIVDDHPVVRDGLNAMLSTKADVRWLERREPEPRRSTFRGETAPGGGLNGSLAARYWRRGSHQARLFRALRHELHRAHIRRRR